jgi:hypothetical protein
MLFLLFDLHRQMKLHSSAESLRVHFGKIPAPFDFAQADRSRPCALTAVIAIRPAFAPVGFEPNQDRRAVDECLRALDTCTGLTVVEHSATVFLMFVEILPLYRRTARKPFVASFFWRLLHGLSHLRMKVHGRNHLVANMQIKSRATDTE